MLEKIIGGAGRIIGRVVATASFASEKIKPKSVARTHPKVVRNPQFFPTTLFAATGSSAKMHLLNFTMGVNQRRYFASGETDMSRLPVGYDDFGKVVDRKLEFVDKSLFIKDVIDDPAEVILITRPRRFGKTFNMSLLHYFFAGDVRGRKTQGMFDGLKIAGIPEYMEQQGKYPVISLTLKEVKSENPEIFYESFKDTIKKLYQEHRVILEEGKLYPEEEKQYQAVLNGTANEVQIRRALESLTGYLYRYHGERTIVLIDEYDTPIQSGYVHGYYDKAVDLMREFLGAALKSNAYLHKAVLTGILRVAKESLFSGLNNVEVYSLLKNEYSQYFGFTEEEVTRLFVESGLQDKLLGAKAWYNGYQIGGTVVYNPWSIVSCIKRKGLFEPYWINTSDNLLIKRTLVGSSIATKEKFKTLLEGNPVEAIIDDNFAFPELESNESAFWNLFLTAGYLKATSQQLTPEGLTACQLEIPNLEVKGLYTRFVKEWLSNGKGIQWYNEFIERLLMGNIEAFEKDIEQIMLQTASTHDVAREPEAFYQGLMIGLTVSLGQRGYQVKSNRESGHGRYDIAIIPDDKSKLALVLELKSVEAPKVKKADDAALQETLNIAAKEALVQINSRHYLADVKQLGIKSVCKIGLAFSGKHLKADYEMEGVTHKQQSNTKLIK